MSIRKSPTLSSQLLDAARLNGRRSKGPGSPAAKRHSKFNALQHGERSDPENHYEVMRALGEDPAKFEALKQELRDSFDPAGGRLEKQVDDLARLYWRRDRLERMETGLMRRALQGVEAQQRGLRRALGAATFDPSQAALTELDLPLPQERCVRLRQLLSRLGVIEEQVKRKEFLPRQAKLLEAYGEGPVGWRAARLDQLLKLYLEWLKNEATRLNYRLDCAPEPEPGVEHYQELLRLLEEERAAVEEEYQQEYEAREERAAIERDACLAPSGEEWKLLLRREETLDRSIDRKIRILLALRKETAQGPTPHPPAATMECRSAECRSAPPPLEKTALSPGDGDGCLRESTALPPGERDGCLYESTAFSPGERDG